MNIYSVYCNAGRYDLNALVRANTMESAKNKVSKQLPRVAFIDAPYRVKKVTLADTAFVKEMELEPHVRTLKRGDVNKVVVYDEGT